MKKRPRKKKNQSYKKLMNEKKEVNYYRNFGTLTDDSVVTDIYNKKFKNKQETIAKECEVRKITDEEYEKYFGKNALQKSGKVWKKY